MSEPMEVCDEVERGDEEACEDDACRDCVVLRDLYRKRPTHDRAAWLLHDVAHFGRATIAASQYEELQAEARCLKIESNQKSAECNELMGKLLGYFDKVAAAKAEMASWRAIVSKDGQALRVAVIEEIESRLRNLACQTLKSEPAEDSFKAFAAMLKVLKEIPSEP